MAVVSTDLADDDSGADHGPGGHLADCHPHEDDQSDVGEHVPSGGEESNSKEYQKSPEMSNTGDFWYSLTSGLRNSRHTWPSL